MSTRLYDSARQAFCRGKINWETDTIRVYLIDNALYDVNAHLDAKVITDIPANARTVESLNLTNTVVTDFGSCDADDAEFPATISNSLEYFVISKIDNVDPNKSFLILHGDTADGLPLISNGSKIKLEWNNSPTKIFRV